MACKVEGKEKSYFQLQILAHYDAYQLATSFCLARLQDYLLKVVLPYPYEIPCPLDQP